MRLNGQILNNNKVDKQENFYGKLRFTPKQRKSFKYDATLTSHNYKQRYYKPK